METDASGQSSIFGNSSQNLHKQISKFPSIVLILLDFLLVDVYYNWEYIVNMSANIKT